MGWLGNNWIWLVFGGAMIAMHLFGHRGHGSHGGHQNGGRTPATGDGEKPQATDSAAPSSGQSDAHSHDHNAPPQAGATEATATDPAAGTAHRHKHGC